MNRIKELRIKKGINQKELGSIIGAAANSVSQYESGSREPSIEILNKLADYFDVSIDYLLQRSNDEKSDIVLNKNNSLNFASPQEALSFILKQEMVANFGGYDLETMSDDEIMDMANDIADMLRIVSRKHKK